MARSLPIVTGEANHRTKGLVRLTMSCNERCLFCNVPVEDYPEPDASEAEIAAELAAFAASGSKTLTISGGEPTARKARLLRLIADARARGVPHVELQTNAILVSADYARELVEAGLTSAFVSLLSDRADLHDELAGLPGAHERCLRGIDAMLEAGLPVTLNPVTARQTQHRVAAYVDFVAARLPGVRAISLSAVQPHGRAAQRLDLLPDYAVLASEVRRAQGRARHHGIVLLNPYCGLPLCVGWSEAADRSVEAIESQQRSGAPHGLDNAGNKRHGRPCRACALRPRCGGAWHAYWDHRGGSGLEAPLRRRFPWSPDAEGAGQTVIHAPRGIDERARAALRRAAAPTVWCLAGALQRGDTAALLEGGATDLALALSADALGPAAVGELEAIADHNRRALPQDELRVVLALTRLGSFRRAFRAIATAAPYVEAVRLLVRPTERHERFVAALRREGLDVALAPRDDALPRVAPG